MNNDTGWRTYPAGLSFLWCFLLSITALAELKIPRNATQQQQQEKAARDFTDIAAYLLQKGSPLAMQFPNFMSVIRRGLQFESVLAHAERRHKRVGSRKKSDMENIITYLNSQGATLSAHEQKNTQ